MRQKHFSMLNAFLGLVLALTPFVLFPVCGTPAPDGGPMKCHYSGIFIVAAGLLVVALSLLSLTVVRKRGVFACACILSAGAALLAYTVPERIVSLGDKAVWGWECGLCGDIHHACRAVTMPAVSVLVLGIVLLNVLALLWNAVSRER